MFNVSKIPAKGTDGKPIDTSRYPGSFVWLNVYDLGENRAMQRTNNLGKMFGGGIYHAALEVYGNEWSYGYTDEPGTGVHKCQPRAAYGHTYRSTTKMGVTKLTQIQVSKLIQKLSDEWIGLDYNLLEHNCLHFANCFADHLGVPRLPSWVDRVGRTAAKITSLAPGSPWKRHSASEEPGGHGTPGAGPAAGPRNGLSTGFGMGAIHDKSPNARGPGAFAYGNSNNISSSYNNQNNNDSNQPMGYRTLSHGAGVGSFPTEEEDLLLGHTGKHFPAHGRGLSRPGSADSLKVSLGRSAPPGSGSGQRSSPSKESIGTGTRSRSLRDFSPEHDFGPNGEVKALGRSTSRRRTTGLLQDEEMAERSKPSLDEGSPKVAGEQRKRPNKPRSASQQPTAENEGRPDSKEKTIGPIDADTKKGNRRSSSAAATANNNDNNDNINSNDRGRGDAAGGNERRSASPRMKSKQLQDTETAANDENSSNNINKNNNNNNKKTDKIVSDGQTNNAENERGRRSSGQKEVASSKATQARSASAEPGRRLSLKRSNTGETSMRPSRSKTRDLDEILAAQANPKSSRSSTSNSNSTSRPRLTKSGSSTFLGRGTTKGRPPEAGLEEEKNRAGSKEKERKKEKEKDVKEKEKDVEKEKEKLNDTEKSKGEARERATGKKQGASKASSGKEEGEKKASVTTGTAAAATAGGKAATEVPAEGNKRTGRSPRRKADKLEEGKVVEALPEASSNKVQSMQMKVKGAGIVDLDGNIKAGRPWQQCLGMPDMLKEEQGSTSSTSTPQGSPRLGKFEQVEDSSDWPQQHQQQHDDDEEDTARSAGNNNSNNSNSNNSGNNKVLLVVVDDYVVDDERSPFAEGAHQEAMVPCSSKVRPMLVMHGEWDSEGSRRSVSL